MRWGKGKSDFIIISNQENFLWKIFLWRFCLVLYLAQDSVYDLANQMTVLEHHSCLSKTNVL